MEPSNTPVVSPRRTRSKSRQNASEQATDTLTAPKPSKVTVSSINLLPSNITKEITGLESASHTLFLRKKRWLHDFKIAIPGKAEKLAQATQATLVFAQEEAGTAVCISSKGVLLTCSHCVAEEEEEFDREKSHWLLFASSQVVEAKTVAWDPKRDLALLQIISAQRHPADETCDGAVMPKFPSVNLATTQPPLNRPLVCIGHPGSEDLETELPGIKTKYDILHVSTGAFRGYASDQAIQDNSEIGALKHDCWTYWGHSGAP
jgi:hypothetical protein